MKRIIKMMILSMLFATPCLSQWTSGRPDGHAPLGVMGDHTHEGGEFMLSYRFVSMQMDGSRDGTDAITASEVVSPSGGNFMISPEKMPMQMHMFGVMFAPSSRITLMAMVPFVSMEMEHLTRAGGSFTTKSSGIGDVSLTALVLLSENGSSRVNLNAGIGLPTGSIEEKDVTPASAPNKALLPYPMQPGSGTLDLRPGLTYLGQNGAWSWGAQATAKIRLGENDSNYRLGNQFTGTFWGARRLSQAFGLSVRLAGSRTGNIEGANPAFAGMVQNRMVPTVFADLRGGTRLDTGLGMNYYLSNGALHGFRLAVEAILPIYQNLDGPQLETDLQIVVGTQYAF